MLHSALKTRIAIGKHKGLVWTHDIIHLSFSLKGNCLWTKRISAFQGRVAKYRDHQPVQSHVSWEDITTLSHQSLPISLSMHHPSIHYLPEHPTIHHHPSISPTIHPPIQLVICPFAPNQPASQVDFTSASIDVPRIVMTIVYWCYFCPLGAHCRMCGGRPWQERETVTKTGCDSVGARLPAKILGKACQHHLLHKVIWYEVSAFQLYLT